MRDRNQDKSGEEIREVIREEKNRLRPAGDDANRRYTKRLRQMKRLLDRGTEEDLINAMRAAGISDGSPEALTILKIWMENRS